MSILGMSERELTKLKEDLEAVMDRVRLCREMLPNSPGIREDEALAEVIGFLEACKPRMVSTNFIVILDTSHNRSPQS